eukprot:UN31345
MSLANFAESGVSIFTNIINEQGQFLHLYLFGFVLTLNLFLRHILKTSEDTRYFVTGFLQTSFIIFISSFKYYHDFYGHGNDVWNNTPEYRLTSHHPINAFTVTIIALFDLSDCFFDKLKPEFIIHHISVWVVAFFTLQPMWQVYASFYYGITIMLGLSQRIRIRVKSYYFTGKTKGHNDAYYQDQSHYVSSGKSKGGTFMERNKGIINLVADASFGLILIYFRGILWTYVNFYWYSDVISVWKDTDYSKPYLLGMVIGNISLTLMQYYWSYLCSIKLLALINPTKKD